MAAAKKKAGQSSRSLAQRKADNKGVKDGTVRRGAAGKADRKYNAKTGRWEIIRVGAASKSQPSKQQASAAKARSASSERMTAMAKDKAASSRSVPSKQSTAKKPWYAAGGGGLVGPNSPLRNRPKSKQPRNSTATSPMTWGMKKGK